MKQVFLIIYIGIFMMFLTSCKIDTAFSITEVDMSWLPMNKPFQFYSASHENQVFTFRENNKVHYLLTNQKGNIIVQKEFNQIEMLSNDGLSFVASDDSLTHFFKLDEEGNEIEKNKLNFILNTTKLFKLNESLIYQSGSKIMKYDKNHQFIWSVDLVGEIIHVLEDEENDYTCITYRNTMGFFVSQIDRFGNIKYSIKVHDPNGKVLLNNNDLIIASYGDFPFIRRYDLEGNKLIDKDFEFIQFYTDNLSMYGIKKERTHMSPVFDYYFIKLDHEGNVKQIGPFSKLELIDQDATPILLADGELIYLNSELERIKKYAGMEGIRTLASLENGHLYKMEIDNHIYYKGINQEGEVFFETSFDFELTFIKELSDGQMLMQDSYNNVCKFNVNGDEVWHKKIPTSIIESNNQKLIYIESVYNGNKIVTINQDGKVIKEILVNDVHPANHIQLLSDKNYLLFNTKGAFTEGSINKIPTHLTIVNENGDKKITGEIMYYDQFNFFVRNDHKVYKVTFKTEINFNQ